MSQNSPFSFDEYPISVESPFSFDEYPISVESPFSIEEYCVWTSNTPTPSSIGKSVEFSIDEYCWKEDLTCEENHNQTATSAPNVAQAAQSEINGQNEPTTVCEEDFQSASPMHFTRVPRRNSRERFALVTSENQLRVDINKDCCARGCMSAIGKDKLRALRRYYFSLTGDEQDTYLMTHMHMVKDILSNIKISFEYYLFYSQQCCRVAFKISLCVSNMRLHRVQQRVLNGDTCVDGGDVPSMKGASGRNAIGWMKNYFKLNCEVMPTTGRLHLSDNYTRREVYDAYKSVMLMSSDKYVTYSQFTRLWSSQFRNVVIPRKVRMGYCSICANLKSMTKGAKTTKEKDVNKQLLQDHREAQALERTKAMHHREKSLKKPEQYMCLMIDGMDQKKTCLPHFTRLPKDLNDECLVQMHLVGCLAYNGTIKPHVFITYPNVHNDPNLTVTVIQRVLMNWGRPLPPILYIQLDNTARENKNSTVFGYLSMLVEQGVFRKVKVNFLLVGHTHDHIDQMFSTFSRQLSRHDAFTLPKLFDVICDAYTPRPNVLHLKEIYDFKRYIADGGEENVKVLAQLNNISFNHVFLILKNNISGCTLLYAKQYSSSPQWEPESGCQFLLHMPLITIVHGAKQMLIETKKEMKSDLLDEQRNFWMQALKDKKKHIDNAKKYAGSQDTSWWDMFFTDQEGIIENYFNGIWPLQVPFTWFVQHTPNSQTSPRATNVDLDNLLHPQQRHIYVGPRMTKAAEARWQGDTQEIKVGMLIATPADDNDMGHQFWIGKVLDVVLHENQSHIKSTKVHWYNTKSRNAFTGKYTLEMMECPTTRRNRKRKRNIRNTSTLDMQEVDIIVYDFTLTKAGRLRKSTIDIIKEKLPSLQGCSSRRRTRSSTHDLESAHLLLDEDNALIGTSDEEEDASPLYDRLYSSDSYERNNS